MLARRRNGGHPGSLRANGKALGRRVQDRPVKPVAGLDRDALTELTQSSYIELVDWSGRAIIEGKRGSIRDNLPTIFERLKIDPDNYVRFINRTQKHRFHSVIGAVDRMRDLAGEFGRTFLKGQSAAAALFSPG